jgi:antitoxin (DNA-binding transcriptional repressor) of toxin-antitoxin stability system
MKKTSISSAKTNLSAIIDSLKGSSVLIVDRGRPVARLESALGDAAGGGQDGKLLRLLRDGLVRPRRGRHAKGLFSGALPKPRGGASAVDALIEQRREGR